jgi:thioredoxin 1
MSSGVKGMFRAIIQWLEDPQTTRRRKMTKTLAVNDASFGLEFEQQDGLNVIDFWASWCAPCRVVGSIVDQLAEEYQGRARVAKLNIDENPERAKRFEVRSIPTILFLKRGQVVDAVVGAAPKSLLAAKIEQHAK